MLLARLTGGTVTAVDTHAPFLAVLAERAAAAGVTVRTLEVPMAELALPDGSVDLLWAEGSAYLMGVDTALAAWRRMLSPSGVLVFTDAVWTTPRPSAGARAFWDTDHPGMRTTAATAAAVKAAGWTVLATYLLPEADWAAYYEPLGARLAELAATDVDPVLLEQVGEEIGVRAAHGAEFGYAAYVLRPRR